MHSPLELREIFHLEFLSWLGRSLKPGDYCLKGGANLRFFFGSIRYSEDMDMDVGGIEVHALRDAVMKILASPRFQGNLRPFGVERVVPPDTVRAKQTETTQRFKVHLVTSAGEDLFTKVEFSRRGFKGTTVFEPVTDAVLRSYKLSPLLVPHYDIRSALAQKVAALATRSVIQARDIFDLYMLSSRFDPDAAGGRPASEARLSEAQVKKAHDNVFEVSFEQFRDTVGSYLAPDDRGVYDSAPLWDEMKLKTAQFIEELGKASE